MRGQSKMENDFFSRGGVPKVGFPFGFLGFSWGTRWVPLQTIRVPGMPPVTLVYAIGQPFIPI